MKLKKKIQKINLNPVTTRLGKLTVALALLLVPTTINSHETCKPPLGITRTSPLDYPTANVYNMVAQCFQQLNTNSIQMFGAPMIPHLGINQCVCITEKIRVKYRCIEEYMTLVQKGTAGEVLGEYSKECILDGAMGEAARRAYLEGVSELEKESDNKTESTPKKENDAKPASPNRTPTWKELSSQG